ncbi:hypothetical protein [Methylobacterium sp. WL120]|uniref:phage late control D family protein n=1 Tax=Methylobacterium sp. WL120 TaxID=2603887 RepID=UPI0011C81BA1|nr:hypothetical protein [Methylobacterium sp. WL120]TXM68304.1 hypothetical protein FV229_08010 [Methylobacterium sp. WL120]
MADTFTPVYKIMKDGADITNRFNDRTISIQVMLKGGGGDSDTCAITIDDRDWKVADVEVGANLEVYLGYKEIGYAQQGIFKVITVDYEINPRQIKITGTSVNFGSTVKAPANKSYEDKKLSDILGDIAKSAGAGTAIDSELGDMKIPFLNQTSSPLHLMHELERRFGAVAKFENNKLVFNKRDGGESTSGLRTPLLVLQPWNVSSGFVRHTQRGEFSSVKVGWFDADHIKKFVEQATPNAPSNEDGSPDENTFLSGKIARSEEEAKAMAKSQVSQLARSMGEAHMTLSKGDPWIRDQTQLLIKGFRSKIDGSYVIDTVTHTYVKDQGIGTEILAKPPGDAGDYTSLDDGEFNKLGTGGVVGDVGPQLPDPTQGPIGGTPPEPPEPEPTVPDVPINT